MNFNQLVREHKKGIELKMMTSRRRTPKTSRPRFTALALYSAVQIRNVFAPQR